MVNPDTLQGDEFINKFLPMLEGMMTLGMTKSQALKAICTQDFVRDFVDTPEWLVGAKSLPKGCKWSDGTKYHTSGRRGNHAVPETYWFLQIDEDLYIKGYFSQMILRASNNEKNRKAPGKEDDGKAYWNYKAPPKDRNRIIVIRDWKSLRGQNVVYRIGDVRSPFFSNCIMNFWHANGGDCGMTNKIMRDLEEKDDGCKRSAGSADPGKCWSGERP